MCCNINDGQFTIVPNAECGGFDVFERGDDEPVAWFADQQGADDWVYYVLRHPLTDPTLDINADE